MHRLANNEYTENTLRDTHHQWRRLKWASASLTSASVGLLNSYYSNFVDRLLANDQCTPSHTRTRDENLSRRRRGTFFSPKATQAR